MPVWQRAHKLVLRVYEISNDFPQEEKYSLMAQIRRAMLSVTGNIAEAFGRYHYLDKVKFYLNARGLLNETKNYWLIAKDLGYVDGGVYAEIYQEIDAAESELNKVIKGARM